jgi:hypothetical protein
LARISRVLVGIAAAAAFVAGIHTAIAQTSNTQPTSSGVTQQFKSGADQVGQGAAQIGEGIKQGAIMTWEAIKSGAAAAAAKFNGSQSSPGTKSPAPPAQQSH